MLLKLDHLKTWLFYQNLVIIYVFLSGFLGTSLGFWVFLFSKVLGSCPFGYSQSLPILITRKFSQKNCERSACFALFLVGLSGSWGLSRRVLLEPALLGSWVLSLEGTLRACPLVPWDFLGSWVRPLRVLLEPALLSLGTC